MQHLGSRIGDGRLQWLNVMSPGVEKQVYRKGEGMGIVGREDGEHGAVGQEGDEGKLP